MQPDYVKIDMSIVRDIHRDKDRQALAVSTLNYARPREIKVIAEGVETAEEMEKLISLGIDYLQGFYVGRPDTVVKDVDEKIQREIKELNEKAGKRI